MAKKGTKKGKKEKKMEGKKAPPQPKKLMDDYVLEQLVTRKFLRALIDEFDADWVVAGPTLMSVAIAKGDDAMAIILRLGTDEEGNDFTAYYTPPKEFDALKPPTAKDLEKLKRAIEKGAYKTKFRYKPKKK